MIRFDPNTLYSLAELKKRLRGVTELPTFLERLGLRHNRVFRDSLWGWEILDAARKAEAFSEVGKPCGIGIIRGARALSPSRSGVTDRDEGPTRRLSARDLES